MSTVNVNRVVDASGGVLAPISSVMRNRIINGAMVIDQRNAGASVTVTSDFTFSVDRWMMRNTASSKLSVQQNAGSVTPPSGFRNYVGVTSLSSYSVGSTDFFAIEQRIEGFNFADLMFGTANAQTVTVSFWVRSSLTGTFGGCLRNGASDYNYPFTYSISSANTWEYKTVTIAGATAGTWVTNNGIGAILGFNLGLGSTYTGTGNTWNSGAGGPYNPTGATSVVGTNGATWYVTGVQLEVGTQATSFEYRQYQQELALCYRYAMVTDVTVFAGGIGDGTTQIWATTIFPVPMRAAPSTITASGTCTFSDNFNADYSTTSGTNATTVSNVGGRVRFTGFTGLTLARFYSGIGGNGKVIFNAEL
jgi:hypothetical protein